MRNIRPFNLPRPAPSERSKRSWIRRRTASPGHTGQLSVRTCLMIFLYDAPTATSCRADEHSQIIEAIAKRDTARAERLMLEHLEHIESSMKLDIATEEVDLEAIFKG